MNQMTNQTECMSLLEREDDHGEICLNLLGMKVYRAIERHQREFRMCTLSKLDFELISRQSEP